MDRLIKRYENRKLYDTKASAYVSQADIARLVRSGETVVIIDNVSGEDLTAQVLTQIMLEEGKQGDDLLPTDLLHDLLRKGGEAAANSLEQLRHGVDEIVQQSMDRLGKLVPRSKSGELEKVRQQLEDLEAQLSDVRRALEERQQQRDESNDGPPPDASTQPSDPPHSQQP